MAGAGRPEPELRSFGARCQMASRQLSRREVLHGGRRAVARDRKAASGGPEPEGRSREAGSDRPEPEGRGRKAGAGRPEPGAWRPRPAGRGRKAESGRQGQKAGAGCHEVPRRPSRRGTFRVPGAGGPGADTIRRPGGRVRGGSSGIGWRQPGVGRPVPGSRVWEAGRPDVRRRPGG